MVMIQLEGAQTFCEYFSQRVSGFTFFTSFFSSRHCNLIVIRFIDTRIIFLVKTNIYHDPSPFPVVYLLHRPVDTFLLIVNKVWKDVIICVGWRKKKSFSKMQELVKHIITENNTLILVGISFSLCPSLAFWLIVILSVAPLKPHFSS